MKIPSQERKLVITRSGSSPFGSTASGGFIAYGYFFRWRLGAPIRRMTCCMILLAAIPLEPLGVDDSRDNRVGEVRQELVWSPTPPCLFPIRWPCLKGTSSSLKPASLAAGKQARGEAPTCYADNGSTSKSQQLTQTLRQRIAPRAEIGADRTDRRFAPAPHGGQEVEPALLSGHVAPDPEAARRAGHRLCRRLRCAGRPRDAEGRGALALQKEAGIGSMPEAAAAARNASPAPKNSARNRRRWFYKKNNGFPSSSTSATGITKR